MAVHKVAAAVPLYLHVYSIAAGMGAMLRTDMAGHCMGLYTHIAWLLLSNSTLVCNLTL